MSETQRVAGIGECVGGFVALFLEGREGKELSN